MPKHAALKLLVWLLKHPINKLIMPKPGALKLSGWLLKLPIRIRMAKNGVLKRLGWLLKHHTKNESKNRKHKNTKNMNPLQDQLFP